MDNLEQQLGAVLGNPEMMEKIMAMARLWVQATPNPRRRSLPHRLCPISISVCLKGSRALPVKAPSITISRRCSKL